MSPRAGCGARCVPRAWRPRQRGAVTLWDLEHDPRLARREFDLPRGDSGPAAVAVSPVDGRVAWSGSGGRGAVWAPEGGVPEAMFDDAGARLLAWTPDGTR